MDYLELLPEMYRNSQLLKDYMAAVGAQLDSFQDDVAGLYTLVNPNNVPINYIQNLASLVNLSIYGVGTRTDAQLRQQLIQAVDWYKIKGTYQSLIDIAYLFGLSCSIKDLYTKDYVNFVPEDWFIGDLKSNPGSLSSLYYKSPHFGCYFLLNNVKSDAANLVAWDDSSTSWDDSTQLWGGSIYLWRATDMADFKTFVETIRPVNTVPHYTIQFSPIVKQDGNVQTVAASQIKTQVYGAWNQNTSYFDSGMVFDLGTSYSLTGSLLVGATSATLNTNWLGTTGTTLINFSNGDQRVVTVTNGSTAISWTGGLSGTATTSLVQYFDQSPSVFLNSITTWKLGNGNKGGVPGALASIVLTGPGNDIVMNQQPTYTEFQITIPLSTVGLGLSELGLYTTGGTLLVASVFPDIDKTTDVQLYINVVVNK